jgi:hypothetical protein
MAFPRPQCQGLWRPLQPKGQIPQDLPSSIRHYAQKATQIQYVKQV